MGSSVANFQSYIDGLWAIEVIEDCDMGHWPKYLLISALDVCLLHGDSMEIFKFRQK
jgi:hypothetical protein